VKTSRAASRRDAEELAKIFFRKGGVSLDGRREEVQCGGNFLDRKVVKPAKLHDFLLARADLAKLGEGLAASKR
jgi:hypothetical protein